MVKYLIEHGADVNISSNNHIITPLIKASEYGEMEVVEYLLQHGADVNAKDDEGNSSLKYAKEKNFIEIGQLLLQYGAQY